MKIMKTYKIQSANRKVFFTGDQHYHHKLLAGMRGFPSPSSMNEILITNHNSVVRKKDVVIHAGDFSLGNKYQTEEVLERLNGHHIIVPGDHDRVLEQVDPRLFDLRQPILKTEVEGIQVVVSHFMMTVWARSHYGSWHVHAHVHGHLSGLGKIHDVGVDNNNLYPVSFEDLAAEMAKKPENINYIRPEDRRR